MNNYKERKRIKITCQIVYKKFKKFHKKY